MYDTTGSTPSLSACLNTTTRSGSPLRERGADEVLVHHLEHSGPGQSCDVGDVGGAECEHRQDAALRSLPQRGRNTNNVSENSSTSSGPSTKFGIDTPASAAPIAAKSAPVFCAPRDHADRHADQQRERAAPTRRARATPGNASR
jgi:hypothetical protein